MTAAAFQETMTTVVEDILVIAKDSIAMIFMF